MEAYLPLIVVVGVAVVFAAFEHQGEKRRARKLLEENDRMWNEIIDKHQQAIAEAFAAGKRFNFTIQRD